MTLEYPTEVVQQWVAERDALRAENERLERRFREAEAEWVARFEQLETEINRLRADRYKMAVALGFDPDRLPLAQWLESARSAWQT